MNRIILFFLTAFAVAALSMAPASANCASEKRGLERTVANMKARSSSMGICQLARESASLYRKAATFHRRCVKNAAGRAQAAEYDRAAAQARATARASCVR